MTYFDSIDDTTMAAEDTESQTAKRISEFLRKSIRTPDAREPGFADFFRRTSYPVVHPLDGATCKAFPVPTGSAAEIYIEPMLPCVGDTDVMYHYSNDLAIPTGYPAPSWLPEGYEDSVTVYEVVNSHILGYVYLYRKFVLSRDVTDGGYRVVEERGRSCQGALSRDLYVNSSSGAVGGEIHGPARKFDLGSLRPGVEHDAILCIRCVEWPPEVAGWRSRQKTGGWPDVETVNRVVGRGCDVVGVTHRTCRRDEWMNSHQWRLSFSRAEVTLLNSWTPVQQTAYHLLRVFVKTERLTKGGDNPDLEPFSNYHVKMLMLWACELKPQTWWENDDSLIRSCFQLLRFLEEWLTARRAQHYFITNSYFGDYFDPDSVDKVLAAVRAMTEDSLAQWFEENYVRRCAELCPDGALRRDLEGGVLSEEMMDSVHGWREYRSGETLARRLMSSFFGSMATPTCISGANRDPEFDSLVRRFPFGAKSRRRTTLARYHGPTDASLFMTAALNSLCVNMRRRSDNEARSVQDCLRVANSRDMSSSQKAAYVLERLAHGQHDKATEALQIDLCKACLHSMVAESRPDDRVQCVANVYLAVLYHRTGERRRTRDHLTLAVKAPNRTYVVRGSLLPKIDDSVDVASGLAVLYQRLRSLTLKRYQPREEVGVFSAELFARYFAVKHQLVAELCYVAPHPEEETTSRVKGRLRDELRMLNRLISASKCLFTSDLLLCRQSSNSGGSDLVGCRDAKGQLARILTESSVQQLFDHRRVLLTSSTESSCASPMEDCVELCLYRSCMYLQCEKVCEQRVNSLIAAGNFAVPRVSAAYHDFVDLMDDELVSLLGVTQLVAGTPNSLFRTPITVSKLTLFLYLLTQSKLSAEIPDDKRHADIMSSLATIFDWIDAAQRSIPPVNFVDQLMLKLAERLAVIGITEELANEKGVDFNYLAQNTVFPEIQRMLRSIGITC